MPTPTIAQRFKLAAGGLLRAVGLNYNSTNYSIARGRVQHTAPSSPNVETTSRDRVEVMRLMRYLEKNNTFLQASLNSSRIYAIGNGFRYQPLSSDTAYNLAAKELIADLYARPEITLRYQMRDTLWLALKSYKVDGEIFFLKTKHPSDGAPCAQAIQADKVVQPPIATSDNGWVDGIKFDRQGRPVSYAVQNDAGNFQYYGAASIIHIYNPERFGSARGISPYQVAVTTLRDRAEMLESEKLAVKQFSRRAFVLYSKAGEFDEEDAGILGSTPRRTGGTTTDEIKGEFGGNSIALEPGEDLKPFDFPNRPSPAWMGLDNALQREASTGMGQSLDFLVDPTKIGGPVVRMELAKIERANDADQSLLIERFLKPFVRYALAVRIEQGLLKPVPGWERMAFQTPRRLSVDVGRDTAAMIREVELGVRNKRDVIEEQGDEYEAQTISRLDDFAWEREQCAKRGLPFDLAYKVSNQPVTPVPTDTAGEQAPPQAPVQDTTNPQA